MVCAALICQIATLVSDAREKNNKTTPKAISADIIK